MHFLGSTNEYLDCNKAYEVLVHLKTNVHIQFTNAHIFYKNVCEL